MEGRRGGLQHDRPYLAFMSGQAGACREKLRTQAVTPGKAAEYLDDKRQGRRADLCQVIWSTFGQDLPQSCNVAGVEWRNDLYGPVPWNGHCLFRRTVLSCLASAPIHRQTALQAQSSQARRPCPYQTPSRSEKSNKRGQGRGNRRMGGGRSVQSASSGHSDWAWHVGPSAGPPW